MHRERRRIGVRRGGRGSSRRAGLERVAGRDAHTHSQAAAPLSPEGCPETAATHWRRSPGARRSARSNDAHSIAGRPITGVLHTRGFRVDRRSGAPGDDRRHRSLLLPSTSAASSAADALLAASSQGRGRHLSGVVARWDPSGVHRRPRRTGSALDPRSGFRRGPRHSRDGRCEPALLVSRQPVRGIRRTGQDQEGTSRRWADAGGVRRTRNPGRRVESRWRDSLRARSTPTALSSAGGRRHALARHRPRPGES